MISLWVSIPASVLLLTVIIVWITTLLDCDDSNDGD